jgi:hypothetical protein
VEKRAEVPAVAEGKILAGVSPKQMLEALGICPDLDYAGKAAAVLDYVHYSHQELDFYFVRNTTDKWVSRNCYFRQQGKAPEIWDPQTGEVQAVPVYQQEEKRIQIPLTLAPYGAYFVVFRKGPAAARTSGFTWTWGICRK